MSRAAIPAMVSSQASPGMWSARCGKPDGAPICSTVPRCTCAVPSCNHAPSVPGPKSGRGSGEKPSESQ